LYYSSLNEMGLLVDMVQVEDEWRKEQMYERMHEQMNEYIRMHEQMNEYIRIKMMWIDWFVDKKIEESFKKYESPSEDVRGNSM
jgi:hypothetical protein